MKILLLNTSDKTGGAAIACNRLMHALNKNGVEANMLVLDKQTDDPHVYTINTGFLKKQINLLRFLWERWVIFVYNRFSRENLFKVSLANTGNDLSNHTLVKEADIIHIQWINKGLLSLKDIKKLTHLGKPIVCTMHDQWYYTGICHYVNGCDKFETQCSNCQSLKGNRNVDLSYLLFEKKKTIYRNQNITMVGCSNWITNECKRSSLMKDIFSLSIPNAIDTQLYQPQDKLNSRKYFNLPLDKKLILFGACKVTDKRKGVDFLIKSHNIMFENQTFSTDNYNIVIFGAKSEDLVKLLPYSVINVGYIYNSEEMTTLYNAVDLFLIPSLEDNLPNTIMESMSCGTPCVGFNTGGIPEMIDHKQNGYLAEYLNAEDLASGIQWVLNNPDYESLCKNARQKVVTTYSENIIAEKFINLYKHLINKKD